MSEIQFKCLTKVWSNMSEIQVKDLTKASSDMFEIQVKDLPKDVAKDVFGCIYSCWS